MAAKSGELVAIASVSRSDLSQLSVQNPLVIVQFKGIEPTMGAGLQNTTEDH